MVKPSIIYINKAKIVIFPIKSVRSIKINTIVGCGACYETKKNSGIFHFLEHMLLQGTKNLPSSEKISEFAKEKIIAIKGRHVEILDMPLLKKMCEVG